MLGNISRNLGTDRVVELLTFEVPSNSENSVILWNIHDPLGDSLFEAPVTLLFAHLVQSYVVNHYRPCVNKCLYVVLSLMNLICMEAILIYSYHLYLLLSHCQSLRC